MEDADTNSKPKYLNELFILLRVVLHSPDLEKLKGSAEAENAQLWAPFKGSLAAFAAKGLAKHKDVKKSLTVLARLLGLSPDDMMTMANNCKQTDVTDGTETKETLAEEAEVEEVRQKKTKRLGDKKKKEAKQRRMAATSEGFQPVALTSFAQLDTDDAEADEPLETAESHRKSAKAKKMKATDTNGNQVEKKNKKKKKEKTVDDELAVPSGKSAIFF